MRRAKRSRSYRRSGRIPKRRCILPVDGFYKWMAKKGGKQPYAIAMKDRSPFGIAVIWENWRSQQGEWVRTFALTTPSNDLVARTMIVYQRS